MAPPSTRAPCACAPLELTPKQAAAHEATAMQLVDQTIHAYQEYVHIGGRTLDAVQWKPLKASDRMAIYRQRPTAAAEPKAKPKEATPSPPPQPLVCAVGTIDDMLYGVMGDSAEALHLRATYRNDPMELVDAAVLATIAAPTARDPFHFVGICWELRRRSRPAALAAFSRRDFERVYLTAHGVTKIKSKPGNYLPGATAHTPNATAVGERIGYFVVHAVDDVARRAAQDATNAHPFRRGRGPATTTSSAPSTLSLCFLVRELGHGQLDVFVRGTLDRQSNVAVALVLDSVLHGVERFVECAYAKKLQLQVVKAASKTKSTAAVTEACSQCHKPPSRKLKCFPCACCNKVSRPPGRRRTLLDTARCSLVY